ncbi:MAG: (2Fe-2S)-binding protein [Desulfobacterales bacterium]|nr:(2Fe-2S)-binding protein [Desulfobacterales bacterium]
MMPVLELKVNGQNHIAMVDASETLLDVLRDKLMITSPKAGCNTGDCGTCSVLLDGKLVRSCLTLALTCQDREITTVEGLAHPGELHPLQKAFHENYGSQCGFCTPGMILAAKEFLDENPSPTREQVKAAMAGNLCRCTGYVKIIDSVMEAAPVMASEKGR